MGPAAITDELILYSSIIIPVFSFRRLAFCVALGSGELYVKNVSSGLLMLVLLPSFLPALFLTGERWKQEGVCHRRDREDGALQSGVYPSRETGS